MNTKIRKTIASTLMILTIMHIGTTSKALEANAEPKITAENKPGTTIHTNISVSDSYQLCYDMRREALGSDLLDTHLTTNADWGAAAYLGLSVYGGVRSKEGTAVTIDGKSYNSTTNNITGVMNMGKNYTQTASLVPTTFNITYITKLNENINTKYVEKLGTKYSDAINKGRAFGETMGWYSSSDYTYYPPPNYPVGIRAYVFGYINSHGSYNYGFGARRSIQKYNISPCNLELICMYDITNITK